MKDVFHCISALVVAVPCERETSGYEPFERERDNRSRALRAGVSTGYEAFDLGFR